MYVRKMKRALKVVLQIAFPFVLGLAILWWMYRGTDWKAFFECVRFEMHWEWLPLSLAIGILPQTARAWRWKMALLPLGEQPRMRSCVDSIFVSYAASLVVPRIGEVTRCATLKKYEHVGFTKALGTVVTERVVDALVMLLFTAVAICTQLPTLHRFLETTGTSFGEILHRFTTTGWLVTFVCLIAALGAGIFCLRKFSGVKKVGDILRDLLEGIRSLQEVKNLPLYLFYSLLIWVGYFLHFYLAFFCFDFTAHVAILPAFLIFCVGSFAVLVPTPNGAGSWHFAVKTMLLLYGVMEPQAILFVLVIHTLQTALVIVLGIFGWIRLRFRRPLPLPEPTDGEQSHTQGNL